MNDAAPTDASRWGEQLRDTFGRLLENSLADPLMQAFGQDVSDAIARALEQWQKEPERFREILGEWSESLNGALPADASGVVSPVAAAKAYEKLYARFARCLGQLTDEVPDLDDRTRHLLQFAARQLLSASAPQNWPATNPKVIEKAMTSQGASLLQGWTLLGEDIARSGFGLRVRTANPDDYQIGETLASTPGEVVFESPLFQLIQYYPASQRVHREPILLVPPCINKFYVLDLTPADSMVQWLIRQGYTVFMVSWAVPPLAKGELPGYRDYVVDGCIEAVEQVRQRCEGDAVHLVGYCISGTFAACAAAVMQQQSLGAIRSLTLLNTLLDYELPGEIDVFLSPRLTQALQQRAGSGGIIPGDVLGQAFSFLREDRMIWPFVVSSYLMGKAPKPNPLLFWNQDVVDVSAPLLSDYLDQMYLNNRLATDEPYRIDDIDIDLAKLDLPVYVLASERDHIVPWQGSFAGARLFRSPVELVVAEGGHVSAVVHSPTSTRRNFRTGPPVAEFESADAWWDAAEKHKGSWWPHWLTWLAGHGSDQRRPRFPGETGEEPVEPAPGRYVRVAVCATAQPDSTAAQ